MSTPRYPWWGYVKAVLRQYPEMEKEYKELHDQKVVASLSGMPGGGNVSKTTEDVALRELPRSRQLEYDAVRRTIEVTGMLKTGAVRLRLAEMVFFKATHSLEGAAYALHIAYDTARDYHGDMIRLVAYFRGLITYEELQRTQKMALKRLPKKAKTM